MTLNDRLNQLTAENAQLRDRNAELEQLVGILQQRPEFDLSTVCGREQAVIQNLKERGIK